jgi:hypothetical protein
MERQGEQNDIEIQSLHNLTTMLRFVKCPRVDLECCDLSQLFRVATCRDTRECELSSLAWPWLSGDKSPEEKAVTSQPHSKTRSYDMALFS